MKKIIALVAVLFSVVMPVQSQATESKSLVIIDSYFDSRVVSGNVACVTPQGTACLYTAKLPLPASLSHNTNHGNAMVEVAKKQNPSISIIAISAAGPATDVNAGHFIESLRWVEKNYNKVSAVSVSRFFNGPATCTPASTNTAQYGGVVGANQTIKSLILSLKDKGVPVFASTGNKAGTKIDYPACIVDTNSVSVGAMNRKGALVSAYALDINTDYLATSDVYNYKSPILGLIANTTSAGTVAVAATFATNAQLVGKVIAVKP
jgi:hypothetical protein